MTERIKRALQILRKRPMTAGEFGPAMWPDRTGRVCSASGGGDYAAQMLLGRMRRMGYVVTTNAPGSSTWELTHRGRQEASNMDPDWRPAPCRKCKASLMRAWRHCAFCGSALPMEQE